jgi:pimeloyl-ACP methyl ester carboxylesterase
MDLGLMRAFDPHASDYHFANAACLARVSQLAYGSPADMTSTVKTWGMTPVISVEGVMNGQTLLVYDPEKVIVTFRGTQLNRCKGRFWDLLMTDLLGSMSSDPRDGWWGQDLKECTYDTRPDRSRGVNMYQFHSGFLGVFQELWEVSRFRELAEIAAAGDKSVWFTGHSLGAAVALLAAADWLRRGRTVQGVYLFGAPRVGNVYFAEDYDRVMKKRTFRLVNFIDPVTRLPLFATSFVHVGRVCYFDHGGRLHIDYNARRTTLDFWLRDLWRHLWLALSFRHHFMTRYCELTQRAAEGAGFNLP